ncbi:hypothetical protein [Mesorhizobium sp. M1396]|uniref:hypothetical protein n=1 Tax=Mesorhizobium sp. M1396 TaxID=2957095 RepID=UPI003337BEB4
MPNTSVRAAAEGMPEINRRRLLLGLAAASTAAAAVAVAPHSRAAPIEDRELIRLAEALPAKVAEYLAAQREADKVSKYWKSQVWAPDELTVPGTAAPWEGRADSQPGQAETTVLGDYLWRAGDKFPRRIVVKSWHVHRKLKEARCEMRKALKASRLADSLDLELEISRLEKLKVSADTYEREHAKVSREAKEDHGKFWPIAGELHEALEKHVAAIMNETDLTMEGLVIKAQALAEWDQTGRAAGHSFGNVAFRHGKAWHGQIAASILRHAIGGAA